VVVIFVTRVLLSYIFLQGSWHMRLSSSACAI
jgi:hypothetical protein